MNVPTILRNAMRMHFYWAHPELSVREATLHLDRLVGAVATEQTVLDGEPVGPTAIFGCPVPGCEKILHTWLEDGRGKNLTPRRVARKALEQHIRNCHPGLSPREVSLYLDQVELQLTIDDGKKRGEPGRPTQGLADAAVAPPPGLVDPVRPAEPAHASGKAVVPINVAPIKIVRRTSKPGKLVEVTAKAV